MIDYREDNRWTVYVHIVPKEISGYQWDKYYVGITGIGVKARWGKNGNNYKGQGFFNAIKKYGWANIQHEIIAERLTMEEASLLEISLIKQLQSNNNKHGYNNNLGGRYSHAESEDLTGLTFDEVYVIEKLETIRTEHKVVTNYKCRCSCGNEITLNNYQLKYHDHVMCKICNDKRIHREKISRYKSKNVFEIIDDNLYVKTSSGDIIICDASDIDILQRYTIQMENKNGKPSRVRCYNTDLWNKTTLNLEKVLYNWDYYIIYKNENHYDYRKENLYFVDTATFTSYHHLKNNINNPRYLIRKRNGLNIKYYFDVKLYETIPDEPKFKNTDNLDEAIKERNRLLHIKYQDNAPIKELLERFYIYQ